MTAGDESAPESVAEKPSPYTVLLSRQARRNLSENLPLDVAIAATETIQHAIAVNPARVGKPLDEPFDGYYPTRVGARALLDSWTWTRREGIPPDLHPQVSSIAPWP